MWTVGRGDENTRALMWKERKSKKTTGIIFLKDISVRISYSYLCQLYSGRDGKNGCTAQQYHIDTFEISRVTGTLNVAATMIVISTLASTSTVTAVSRQMLCRCWNAALSLYYCCCCCCWKVHGGEKKTVYIGVYVLPYRNFRCKGSVKQNSNNKRKNNEELVDECERSVLKNGKKRIWP